MDIEARRRRLLAGLVALAWLGPAAARPSMAKTTGNPPRGSTRLDARAFGARGDGVRDDTAALQAAIDALPEEGGTLLLPPGRYLVDPLRSLRLRSRMHLAMADTARLIARPNAAPRAYVLSLHDVHDVEVSGGGIIGDRDRHQGTQGEWGHAIMVRGAQRVTLRKLHLSRCWGDGISIGGISGGLPRPSQDILVADVVCTGNRRQGLTIGRSRRVRVLRSEFVDTGGTSPGCGIDVEPDPGGDAEDIVIEQCLLRGNQGAGIQLYERCHDVAIRRCRVLDNRGEGILVRSARGCTIEDNEIRGNGLRGIAVRGGGRELRIAGNRFSGNASQAKRQGYAERGWMHIDVARGAQSVRVERSNRLGP